MTAVLGEVFARALGRKDAAALRSVLRPDLSFRAMTPRDSWEANDADTVVDDIL